MDYKLIRSKRKTLSMQMTSDGLIVRVPLRCSQKQIDEFLESHKAWIDKAKQRIEEQTVPPVERLSMDEIRSLADRALKYIPERVAFYASKIGVSYGRITIRNQKSRWGSCSSKGNLNFNCLLMLTPPEVIDSVVVHELCHRKEMNHSERFYDEVLRVYPDYHKWNKWLKDNGSAIMRRMTG